MIYNRFYRHHQHDEDCGCGEHHEHDHDMDDEFFEEDALIQIEDEETGEVFDFYMADEFDYKDDLYYVLVPVSDDEDSELVYVIARVVEEDGESYIETLSDEENEELYDVYDQILEESFSEEDEVDEIEE